MIWVIGLLAGTLVLAGLARSAAVSGKLMDQYSKVLRTAREERRAQLEAQKDAE
ncbi:MAG: hypothetical protein SF069_02835 [Phycisphaerae bacterium]|nr:hypothetical protein [Phycisphaerae bacterium]